MSASSEHVVLKVVERFLEHRRSGRRLSIDKVLDEFTDLPDRAETRKASLYELVRARRKHPGPTGSSEHVSTTVSIEPAAIDLPTIEGYDIIEELGRGGMGVVYEAYQQSTGRRVAVKLMLPSTAVRPTARRRFEREVDLIARLEHPNIVSVIDSGVHRDHYFYAMDYIEGRPLDKALAPGDCDAREAMALMAKVSRALDYAHQRGVLHRDLKPINIIVDARGEPHILDFGLATAFDPESARPYLASISEPGQILGTLAYMAPEQARGQMHLISTRSDVYSLGAIAYELLSGKLPCSIFGPLSEVLTRVEQEDPRPPSSWKDRRDRDLDAVLLKALEKRPAERYATAGEFAADLDRYLANRPVTARRVGLPGRTLRWVQRHRAVSALGGLACLLLIVSASIYIHGVNKAWAEAERQAEHQRELASFWAETRRLDDLARVKGPDVRLRETFEEATARIQKKFPDDRSTQANIHVELGENWRRLSVFDRAEAHLNAGLEIRRSLFGEPTALVASTYLAKGFCLKQQFNYEGAEACYRRALAMHRALHDSVGIADDLSYLGKLLEDKEIFDEARQCYEEELAIRQTMPQSVENQIEITNVIYRMGILQFDRGDFAAAEESIRRAEASYTTLFSGRPKEFAVCQAQYQTTLALVLCKRERLDEAESLCRTALATRKSIYGSNQHPTGHFDLAESERVLGEILLRKGAATEAEASLRTSLAMCERLLKTDEERRKSRSLAKIRGLLGESLVTQQKFQEAEPLLLQSHEILKAGAFPASPSGEDARRRLRELYVAWGKPEKLAELRLD